MVFVDRRSFVLVGVVAVACGGDSAADGEDDSTGNDSTQGDDDDDDGSTSAPESSDGGSETDDGADTTAADTSTGTTGCVAHDECRDPLLPACVDGTCSPCNAPDAIACSELDPALPVCGPDGACLECTADDTSACVDNTPVCDVSTSSCIRCTAHEQCPDSACDIETGACFETDCVVDVDIDGGGDYLDITSALAGESDDQCVLRVHAAAEAMDYYQDSLTIDGRTIAVLGVSETRPFIFYPDGNTVDASNGAVLYLSHLDMIGVATADDAVVWVDASALLGGEDGGIIATSASSRWHLRNTWVRTTFPVAPVQLVMGELDAVYSTFIGNDTALQCTGGNATLRNSVVLSEGAAGTGLDCDTFEAEYSAFEDEVGGRNNVALGDFQNSWLEIGLLGGRLSADFPAALATAARWTTGDPTVDIDGDPRPDRDGTMDFAGADVFVAR